MGLATYLVAPFLVVAYEGSDQFVEAAAVTVVGMPLLSYVMVLPGGTQMRLMERWAAGHEVDRAKALDATYTIARETAVRSVVANVVWVALLLVVVGVIAGATGSRLIQYAILGRCHRSRHLTGLCTQLGGSNPATGEVRHRR